MGSVQRSKQCDCCPYGYHIDLDFVKFVENASLGNTYKQRSSYQCPKTYPTASMREFVVYGTSREPRKRSEQIGNLLNDSLENIVSDLEEALNSREYFSDKESLQINRRRPSVGYTSDYGNTHRSRSQPLRRNTTEYNDYYLTTTKNDNYPARKPPMTPNIQSQTYSTALGRTISQIKARQNAQKGREMDEAMIGIAKKDSQNWDQYLTSTCQAQVKKDERTPYEQCKTHFFGSKTPEMKRKPFGLKYNIDLDPYQPWETSDNVQRSASAADMNGFLSMRRKKEGFEEDKPLEMPPFHFEKQVMEPNQYQADVSYIGKAKSYSTPIRDDISPRHHFPKSDLGNYSPQAVPRQTTEEKRQVSVGAIPSSLSTSKPCTECQFLKRKIIDLCERLEISEKILEKRGRQVTHEIGVSTEYPKMIEKCFGFHPKMVDCSTIPQVHLTRDVGCDPIRKETHEKETLVNALDAISLQWVNCASVSTVASPQCYSIGSNTEHRSSNNCDMSTVTEDLVVTADVSCLTMVIPTKETASGDSVASSECKSTATDEPPRKVDQSVSSVSPITSIGIQTMVNQAALGSMYTQTSRMETRTISSATPTVTLVNRGSNTIAELDLLIDDKSTSELPPICTIPTIAIGTQTDLELMISEPRILNDTEIAESLWLMPSKSTNDVAVGDEEAIPEFEAKSHEPPDEPDESLKNNSIQTIEQSREVDESQSDPEALEFPDSADELSKRQDNVETESEIHSRALGHARAAIVKKLLTEGIKATNLPFVRGAPISRSCRVKENKGDSLEYITDQHKTENDSTPSVPLNAKGALKEKVVLKKELPAIPPSKVPEPVPARIPRPKFSKYSPGEASPQSPDEEVESTDRLTPLRSEMRSLRPFSNGRQIHHIPPKTIQSARQTHLSYNNATTVDESSSDSDGSYDTNITEDGLDPLFEMTPELQKALDVLKSNCGKTSTVDAITLEWAEKLTQHEWLKTAARRTASAVQVEGFIDALEELSNSVLAKVVNIVDQNDNTALHYAVSHGNLEVVNVLLDSKLCNLNRANKAGYTPIMLAALCDATDELDLAVIHRLFQLGDINVKATQHGQTALMLAVSHGKISTTKLLLQCHADLNIQDEEGSTALMCAAEHGHREIVKLLLAQPDIDASLSDCDSSTALSIAVENGHRDIGVLIYAHLNYIKNESALRDSKDSTII